jgi:hypothetical protein
MSDVERGLRVEAFDHPGEAEKKTSIDALPSREVCVDGDCHGAL